MHLTIHKFSLNKGGLVNFKEADEIIHIAGSLVKFLHTGEDPQGQLCVWALVDLASAEINEVKICIRGTGHDCNDVDMAQYLGTVIQQSYVWHIFAK